jgi:ubiquinone/menaquinone biosynthesis C-methylase UbiE
MSEKPVYSTWIRSSKIYMFWGIGIGILGLSLFGFIYSIIFVIAVFSIPFIYIAIIVSLTAYQFSSRGGNYQNKIHEIVITNCPLKDEVLDIGCGNGNLIIKYAKHYSNGKYIGIDYWGDDWEYSQQQCMRNDQIEGIGRIEFIKASASKLPFENNSFSNIISCLTFHEVQDVHEKLDSLYEAIRVLKKGGEFAFFDLFDNPKYYKGKDIILNELEKHGIQNTKYQNINEFMKLPFPLNDKKSLKYGVLITGKK